MNNKEAIEKLTNLLNAYEYAQETNTRVMVELNGMEAEALDLAIKALHIVDIINEELSSADPADVDKAIFFDIPYWEKIQERADMRVKD